MHCLPDPHICCQPPEIQKSQWAFLLLQRSCFDFAQHKPGQQHCPAQAGLQPGLHLLPVFRELPRHAAQPDNCRPGLYRAAAEPGGGAAVLPGALLFALA
jgi:hypothetical protein